jgi:hypothetical protein
MMSSPENTSRLPSEESKVANNEQNIHTPPASDRSSHERKDGDDDDAASSSELSDLDDQFDGAPQPSFAQNASTEGPPPLIVEPARYEGGIPVFQPVCSTSPSPRNAYTPSAGVCFISRLMFPFPSDGLTESRPWTNSKTLKSS